MLELAFHLIRSREAAKLLIALCYRNQKRPQLLHATETKKGHICFGSLGIIMCRTV